MPQPTQTKTQHLLTGGEILIFHFAQDAHGSTTEYWEHNDKDGQTLRYFGGIYLSEIDKAYLQALKDREIKLEMDIITQKGYLATLPDGREINSSMVSFDNKHPELIKHNLSYLLFPNRETAIKLLKNEKIVVEYQPQEEIKTKKIKP
jgi:hypothetical protein